MHSAGERDGFEAFYREQYAPGVRLAWALVGRRDVAEELVQDALLCAHDRWEVLQQYDRPDAWLRRVLLNRCTSWHRRRLAEGRLLVRLRSEVPRTVELTEEDGELWRALRSLPRRQAEVLALVVVEDRSVSEVALVLECGEATVRTHLRRGRLRLAELLGAAGRGDADGTSTSRVETEAAIEPDAEDPEVEEERSA